MNNRGFLFRVAIVTALLLSYASTISAKPFSLSSKDTTIYVLTCSPGNEVYSAFGHSALATVIGRQDRIYNYGTFDFNTDNFVLKFARGQLPYALEVEKFGQFQYEYLRDGREVKAQELNLNSRQKARLIDLLNTNALPENKIYKYDFFYDNCSTRIRDIIAEATGEEINWNFSANSQEQTFRDLVDVYLEEMEWLDLGIDLALGKPCDNVLNPGDQDFLPDSLSYLLSKAAINGVPLVSNESEVLPAIEKEITKSFTERTGVILSIVGVILLVLLFYLRRKTKSNSLAKTLLFINGIIGLAVFLLWFFTDHSATAFNFNLLWANPLNLIFVFTKRKGWFKLFFALNVLTLIIWPICPQDLHESLLPIIALFMVSSWLVFNKMK